MHKRQQQQWQRQRRLSRSNNNGSGNGGCREDPNRAIAAATASRIPLGVGRTPFGVGRTPFGVGQDTFRCGTPFGVGHLSEARASCPSMTVDVHRAMYKKALLHIQQLAAAAGCCCCCCCCYCCWLLLLLLLLLLLPSAPQVTSRASRPQACTAPAASRSRACTASPASASNNLPIWTINYLRPAALQLFYRDDGPSLPMFA